MPAMALMCVLSGCAHLAPENVVSDSHTAQPVPAHYQQAPTGADLGLPVNWWTVYGDPVLDRLVEDALKTNASVRSAAARLTAARAMVQSASADSSVQVDASASAGYDRSSASTPAGEALGHRSIAGRTYAVGVNAAWELDLWDRVAKSIDVAQAKATIAESDVAAVKLALTGDVALYYWQCRTAESDLVILRSTMQARAEAENLLKARFKAGVAGELDLARARVELANAEADMIDARKRRVLAEHALATLLSKPLADFSVPVRPVDNQWQLPMPPQVRAGLPADLLERRPDLAASSLRLQVQLGEIGIARAAFYPSISLTGNYGHASSALDNLLHGTSRRFSIGPLSVSLPLLDGQRNNANLAQARARYQEALADHSTTLLVALREVDDALTEIRFRQERSAVQDQSLTAAERAAQIAVFRYDKGVANYLEVIDAERSVLAIQRGLVQNRAQALFASVNLARALGGGWDAATPRTPDQAGSRDKLR